MTATKEESAAERQLRALEEQVEARGYLHDFEDLYMDELRDEIAAEKAAKGASPTQPKKPRAKKRTATRS